jgi:hypothetical protein
MWVLRTLKWNKILPFYHILYGDFFINFIRSSMMIIHVVCVQGLKTELEKASPALGRTAIYTRESRINELPRHEHIFTFCLSFLV